MFHVPQQTVLNVHSCSALVCLRDRFRDGRDSDRRDRGSNGFSSRHHDRDERHTSRVYGDFDSRQPARGQMRSRRDDWEERDWYAASREPKRRRSDEHGSKQYLDVRASDTRNRDGGYVYGDRHARTVDRDQASDAYRSVAAQLMPSFQYNSVPWQRQVHTVLEKT